MREPVVYIMANKQNGTLYVGVTSDIKKRVYEHKHVDIPGFTNRYKCKNLVYYELCGDMYAAISREKQVKDFSNSN